MGDHSLEVIMSVKHIFEKKGYRIFLDEAFPKGSHEDRFLYYELRSHRGTVYPYSETQLAATFYRGRRRKPLAFARSRNYKILQNADDAVVFLFPESDFDDIAQRLQLRRKRVISEKHREAIKQAQQRRWQEAKN